MDRQVKNSVDMGMRDEEVQHDLQILAGSGTIGQVRKGRRKKDSFIVQTSKLTEIQESITFNAVI